jgi:CRP-like cAMP-binding protein
MSNSLIDRLSAAAASALPRQTTLLKLGDVIARCGEPFDACYFPLTCLLSQVVELEEGGTVEAALIGNDGFLGVPLLFGMNIAPCTVFVQIAGEAAVLGIDDFRNLLSVPGVAKKFGKYALQTYEQTAQGAACLAYHPIAARLAKWLLMVSDVVERDVLPLTHEYLAVMLGSQRPTVTIAAGTLETAGLIEGRRGAIRISDREGLEAAACECYRALQARHS